MAAAGALGDVDIDGFLLAWAIDAVEDVKSVGGWRSCANVSPEGSVDRLLYITLRTTSPSTNRSVHMLAILEVECQCSTAPALVIDANEVEAVVAGINARLDIPRVFAFATSADLPQNVQDASNDAGLAPSEFRGDRSHGVSLVAGASQGVACSSLEFH